MNKIKEPTKEWLERNIKPLLVIGAKIKIGKRYAEEIGGHKSGEIITLIEGHFDYDNGLYTVDQTAPSVWNQDAKEFDSIYHLFGNHLENFMDCEVVPAQAEPTTDQINEVIAIFDGWEKRSPREFVKDGQMMYVWEFKYHRSWDYLMPVVLKIKDHKQSCIRLPKNGVADSVYPYVEAMQPMNRALVKADLNGVYNGSYQFIIWFNKNNSTTNDQ